jgi:hypothetical protein
MLPRCANLLFVFAAVLTFAASSSDIRVEENALAAAIQKPDRMALSQILDPAFRYSISYACAAKQLAVEGGRQEWINRVSSLPLRRYQVTLKHLQTFPLRTASTASPNPGEANADLDENWNLAAGAVPAEQHFHTVDFWKYEPNGWKLVRRISIAASRHCPSLAPLS